MDKEKVTIILAFIAIYFIWGSTYLFNKILLTDLPPFQLSGIRFISAGVLIVLLAFMRKIPLRATSLEVRNSMVAGFFFLTAGNGCLVWSLKFIDSGFAALLISTQPLILLFMLLVMRNQKIPMKSYIGVALGILGIFLLTYAQGITAAASWKGIGLIAISLFCWGYASIFVGQAELPKNQFVNSAYQMLLSGILLMIGSFLVGEKQANLLDLSWNAYGSLAFLVIFGSIIAFTSFNYLLKKVSPEKVSTSTYINPIVAMFLGWWILQEPLPILSIIAAVILLGGVYFINSAKLKS